MRERIKNAKIYRSANYFALVGTYNGKVVAFRPDDGYVDEEQWDETVECPIIDDDGNIDRSLATHGLGKQLTMPVTRFAILEAASSC